MGEHRAECDASGGSPIESVPIVSKRGIEIDTSPVMGVRGSDGGRNFGCGEQERKRIRAIGTAREINRQLSTAVDSDRRTATPLHAYDPPEDVS